MPPSQVSEPDTAAEGDPPQRSPSKSSAEEDIQRASQTYYPSGFRRRPGRRERAARDAARLYWAKQEQQNAEAAECDHYLGEHYLEHYPDAGYTPDVS